MLLAQSAEHMDPRRPLGGYRELGYGGSGHGSLPFGYGIQPSGQEDLEESQDALIPPEPPGGELLDNNDQMLLSNFWNSIGDSEMPDNGFLSAVYTENWCLPPEVVGHNVSYGTAADGLIDTAYPNLTSMSLQPWGLRSPNSITLPAGSTAEQSNPELAEPSPEVIAAATALSSRPGQLLDMLFNTAAEIPSHVSSSAAPAQHQEYGSAGNNARQLPSNSNHRSNSLRATVFHDPFHGQSYSLRPPLEEVQFGSDPNFNRVNFVPRSARETTEAISAEQLATLGCLQRNPSSAPTRVPSPVSITPPSPPTKQPSLESPARLKPLSHPLTPDEPECGDSDPPRKRRRSTKMAVTSPHVSSTSLPGPDQSPTSPVQDAKRPASAAAGSVKASSTITPLPRRRKPPGPAPLSPETEGAATASAAAVVETDSKRRKSSASGVNGSKTSVSASSGSGGAKQPRANLTDEQKRENHIRSEQKRRDLIKDHFNDLGAIVPALKSGGYSKAVMLNLSADWLVEVMAGNQRLMESISRCRNRSGSNGAKARISGPGQQGAGLKIEE